MLSLLLVALMTFAISAGAIRLPSHIASGMVLQQGVPVSIWGLDVPLASISGFYGSTPLPPATCDATGRFTLSLPAAPASTAPTTISISSSSGTFANLTDVLVGDVYVCSGQSNMGLSVNNIADVSAILAASTSLGPLLRVFQVATLDEYSNTTTPQVNLTASIPWSRASPASIPGMSAMCYLFGAHAVSARGIPIGLMANAWGGVAIQVYMSPASLAKCGAAASLPPTHAERIGAASLPGASRADAALASIAAAELAFARANGLGSPTNGSCLYNSMVYPLFSVPIRGILWYQGESNAGDPVGYQCLQREMISDWRTHWAAAGSAADTPFLFVQLSAWPTGSTTHVLPIMRVAVEQTLRDLPRVGMVVAADIADPAGAYHPIHPPWKAELGRRAWLWADAVIYGNASSPTSGPRPVSAVWDAWAPSWGDSWHFGSGGNSYVCESTTWTCAGVRVTFDAPVQLRSLYVPGPTSQTERAYGFVQGPASGFELLQDGTETAWSQRAPITAISADGRTVFLNTTWIGPQKMPTVLKYAWQDYPDAMPLEGAGALPVGPFNLTLSM